MKPASLKTVAAVVGVALAGVGGGLALFGGGGGPEPTYAPPPPQTIFTVLRYRLYNPSYGALEMCNGTPGCIAVIHLHPLDGGTEEHELVAQGDAFQYTLNGSTSPDGGPDLLWLQFDGGHEGVLWSRP